MNYHLAYITQDDLCESFPDQHMLGIQAPFGTQLEVPAIGADEVKNLIYLFIF